jgi:hypothetical protein
VTFWEVLGIGFSCAGFGGPGVRIIGVDYNFGAVVASPSGSIPLPLPEPWGLSWPKPEIQGGIGWEGAWKISEPNSTRAGVF